MTGRNKPRPTGEQVSDLTAGRLSVYLRCLNALEQTGVKTTSSKSLASAFHLNAAQIRKDLAYFGEFGVRGVGYYVSDLKTHLRAILGLDRPVRVAILGAGNLGLALADYPGFKQEGFVIVGLYDTATAKIGGRSREGVRIHDMGEFKRMACAGEVDIAAVAVPADAAQPVVNLVAECGVRAILNFSPGALRIPSGVKLKNVDLTVSLEGLSFFLARGDASVPTQ